MRSAGAATSGHRDEGGATVLAAVIATALVLSTVLGLHLGAAVLTRHRATAAADLGALAAAAQAVAGTDSACRRAEWVADRYGVRLTACRLRGWEAAVEVTAQPPGWLAATGTASAHARAGPAEVSEGG
ncbi:secretion/DNA translocation related TadE-like protein [Kutzneria viridogrisea]|uniref:Secretion/DNA translocation related TadE-like protein n=1 Tax=Kutzneria viridogrisea TaxID=47990 RepID=A0ABR6BWK6_9PSEU|nr:secretion/DNA translocation related TadE-like protein [Kutzneria viridogrisea]